MKQLKVINTQNKTPRRFSENVSMFYFSKSFKISYPLLEINIYLYVSIFRVWNDYYSLKAITRSNNLLLTIFSALIGKNIFYNLLILFYFILLQYFIFYTKDEQCVSNYYQYLYTSL